MLLEIARWPIVLWAVVNAALRWPYMITPKGARAPAGRPGARLYGPPVLAELALGAVAVFQAGGGHTATQGYLALVLFNLVLVVMLLVTALALEVGTCAGVAAGCAQCCGGGRGRCSPSRRSRRPPSQPCSPAGRR